MVRENKNIANIKVIFSPYALYNKAFLLNDYIPDYPHSLS